MKEKYRVVVTTSPRIKKGNIFSETITIPEYFNGKLVRKGDEYFVALMVAHHNFYIRNIHVHKLIKMEVSNEK